MASNVRWIAVGPPVNDNEVFPDANKYTPLVYEDDPIRKFFGLSGPGCCDLPDDNAILGLLQRSA